MLFVERWQRVKLKQWMRSPALFLYGVVTTVEDFWFGVLFYREDRRLCQDRRPYWVPEELDGINGEKLNRRS